jgi:hypothetical protein
MPQQNLEHLNNMKKILKEEEAWEQVSKKKAAQLESSGNYEVKTEGGKFYARKKASTPPPPPPPAPPKKEDPQQQQQQTSSPNIQDYVGQYKTQNGANIDASMDNGKLRVKVDSPVINTLLTDKGNDNFEFEAYGQKATCVGKRENGRVVSVTITVAGQSVVATKVVTAQPQTQTQTQTQTQQQTQVNTGGWMSCVSTMTSGAFYILIDKANNKPLGFGKDQAEADALKANFTGKDMIVKAENVKYSYTDAKITTFYRDPNETKAYTLILRKDGTFVSDSNYKRGLYSCRSNGHLFFQDKEAMILDESKIKKILKEHLYNINL